MNGLDSFLASPLHSDCKTALRNTVKYFEKKYDMPTYCVNLPIVHHALSLWLTSMHSDEQSFGDVLSGFRVSCFFSSDCLQACIVAFYNPVHGTDLLLVSCYNKLL